MSEKSCGGRCATKRPPESFGWEQKRQRPGVGFIKDRRSRTDGFSSVRNRRSARTGRRPRKFERRRSMYRPTSADVRRCGRAAIARSRAPTAFSARMKSTSAQKTRLWVKNKGGAEFYPGSLMANGRPIVRVATPRGNSGAATQVAAYSLPKPAESSRNPGEWSGLWFWTDRLRSTRTAGRASPV